MSRLNRIQNEIKQLEGGRFQKLCDMYIYRKRNWENIVSLGSMDGTDKTTRGIPDTYYFDEKANKYILVMYGTRKDAAAKLEIDIKEAIEKTKIDVKEIKEIICCHTSSNISVKKHNELRSLAGQIELTIIGIDTLSMDLLRFEYQDIVSDLLGISESTEQVWNIEQFISVHDNSKTNAPLNTPYITEVDIIEELITEINENQILLLSGVPGTGKTRLAIEVCKRLPIDSNVICVKSNNMPVYQDIKDALDSNRLNYIFLDDANTITNFSAIVNLLRLGEYEQRLRLIITVRDYALSGINKYLEPFKTKSRTVPLMNDSQIELLINSINKVSTTNLRKIMNLSHNNPRAAVIAAVMTKEEKYDFVDNGKEILGSYYDQIIKENYLSQNEKTSLFILSFKNKMNMTDQESLKELLSFLKIDFESFLGSISQLHDKELCDIYQNQATKIRDQSLADFVLIDFIADNKVINIREFFINLYPRNEKEIVDMLIRINNFISSDDWRDYLTDEIKCVYNEFIKENDKEHFLMQYGQVIPIEALAYINEKIQIVGSKEYQISHNEFEGKKKRSRVEDPIIKILCSLSNSNKFNDAGVLLIEYFKKREDKIYEVFSAIKDNFDIKDEWVHYLEKKFSILEIFSKQKNISKAMALLITNILEEFLNFSGERFIPNGKNVIINSYTLADGNYLIKFHRKIFELLFKVYNSKYEEVNNYIDKLLFNYPLYEIENGFVNTVNSDLKYIEEIFFKDLSKLSLREEAIVYNLKSESKKLELPGHPFSEYKPSKKQEIYEVFSSNMICYKKGEVNYDESQRIRAKRLEEVYDDHSNDLLELFNVLAEYQLDELLNKYELEESLTLLYSKVDMADKMKILTNLLNSNFTFNYNIIDDYMKQLPFDNGKIILNNVEKEVDERWYLSNLLTCKSISRETIQELITFLNEFNNFEKINTFSILSFENYIEVDGAILDILRNKYEEGKIMGIFFIPYYSSEDSAKRILSIVGSKELKRIYLASLGKEDFDTSGEVFKLLLEEQDINFVYSFLEKLNKLRLNSIYLKCDVQLKYIWSSKIAEEGIREYLDFLIRENRIIYIGVDRYLEKILKANIERATKFIEAEIRDTEDKHRLFNLYKLSLEIFDDERLLHIFELLKYKDVDASFFEKLNLTMRTHSWSGSLVPVLDKEITFLKKLLDIFQEIEYISYANVITTRIDSLKKQKKKELLSDYLE